MPNYQLTVTEDQLRVVSRALELYMRIHLGQLDELSFELRGYAVHSKKDQVDWDTMHLLLDAATVAFTKLGSPNAYFGVLGPDVPVPAKIACDVYKHIRHRLAWDRCPDGGYTVDFDDPAFCRTTPDMPRPEVKKAGD